MKQLMIRRVLSMALTISLVAPFIMIPASAASFPDEYRDSGSVSDWESAISSPGSVVVNALSNAIGVENALESLFWSMVNQTVTERGLVCAGGLEAICASYNHAFSVGLEETIFKQFKDAEAAFWGNSLAFLFGLGKVHFVVDKHPSSGLLRIKEETNNIWVVNQWGEYPYSNLNDIQVDTPDDSGNDLWISATDVYRHFFHDHDQRVVFTTRGFLESLMRQLELEGFVCSIEKIGGSDFYGINGKINKKGYFWCDKNGYPYACPEDEYLYAANQDRPTSSIVNGNGEELEVPKDMEVGIDFENQFVLLPSSDIVYTGGIIYDIEDKVYNVETHKVNNYTEENYEITTNNYTYEYYIQNTTVTYIGETMDYEKYECYYKLPDGRSSADLTREELEQLNVGIDVVEYSRSTDDVRLRALYHFDGDTKDSSYWNHLSEFHWHEGATINYMDVETFGGAMYLDANIDSAFSIKLPSSLGSGDFTIQFRYYQSQPTAASPTSGLYMNATPMWGWDPTKDSAAQPLALLTGELLLDEPDGSECEYSVGSWNEICITRKGNTFSYFVNGLCLFYTTWADSRIYGDTLMFYFGEDMGAYKMIDELRVLNFAIASGKQAEYEPTAVPHDTNLALVLPDDKIAIADEYWTFESSKENLLEPYGLADWQGYGYGNISPYLKPLDTEFIVNDDGTILSSGYDLPTFPCAFYQSEVTRLSSGSSGLSVDYVFDTDADELNTEWYLIYDSNRVPFYGLFIPIKSLPDGSYTFSVVTDIGWNPSFSFTLVNGSFSGSWRLVDSPSGVGKVAVYPYGSTYIAVNCLDSSFEILYMELVEGSSTDLTATCNGEIAIVDKDDQFKPTLAVRTDLEITDYQIGGVRPTIPEKGLVYAMVESGYITSLQIYNGQAWEACDGRIWTGERWIPYSSYNVITLQDMYDIVDATPGYEYIYTESGFWAWWQKSWNAFTEQLFGLLGSGSSNSGGDADLDDDIPEADPDAEGGATLLEFIVLVFNGGKAVIRGFRDLFSGAVSSVPDAVNTLTSAFKPGGIAVSIFENRDPDFDVVAVMDLDRLDYYQTEEVLDPWRYR